MSTKIPEAVAVMIRVAVHHAVEACANATGQHRTIAHYVNKTEIANEVIEALEAAMAEAPGDLPNVQP